MIVYNCRKLQDFKDSGFCYDELRDKSIDDIYKAICSNQQYLVAYNMFCHIRWESQLSERRIKASAGTMKMDIEDRIRLQERVMAIDAMKQEAKKMQAVQKLISNDIKNYHDLFQDVIDESRWNPLELEIRKHFMIELSNLIDKGGCTSCIRTRLVRKYIDLLKALLS